MFGRGDHQRLGHDGVTAIEECGRDGVVACSRQLTEHIHCGRGNLVKEPHEQQYGA